MAKAAVVFCLTEEEKIDLEDYFGSPKAKLMKIPNGSPLRFERNQSKRVDTIRNSVLFASRLDPRKKPLEFIAAAKKLALKYPTLEFLLAGSDAGALSEVQAELARVNNPRIRYLGALSKEELLETLDRSQVLVHPTEWDVFPMIMVESVCSGVPVVSLAGYEVSEWFAKHNATTLATSDLDSLASAIEDVLENFLEKQRFAEAFASQYLDEEVIANTLISRYQAVLEGQANC